MVRPLAELNTAEFVDTFEETAGRGVVTLVAIARGERVGEARCDFLAELNAPLVERVDTPDDTFDEYFVLIERNELT